VYCPVPNGRKDAFNEVRRAQVFPMLIFGDRMAADFVDVSRVARADRLNRSQIANDFAIYRPLGKRPFETCS
jgi:hypothetical protein